MQWSDIQFQPPARLLRQFAGLWLLFFSALATLQMMRGHESVALGLAALAITIGPLGLWRPAFMRPIYVGWMILVFPVGWVMTRVTLALLFYGLFTPMAWLFRLRGRDALDLRRRSDKESYWTSKPAPADVRRYFNQS